MNHPLFSKDLFIVSSFLLFFYKNKPLFAKKITLTYTIRLTYLEYISAVSALMKAASDQPGICTDLHPLICLIPV